MSISNYSEIQPSDHPFYGICPTCLNNNKGGIGICDNCRKVKLGTHIIINHDTGEQVTLKNWPIPNE